MSRIVDNKDVEANVRVAGTDGKPGGEVGDYLPGVAGTSLMFGLFTLLTTSAARKKPLTIDKSFDGWLIDHHKRGLESYLGIYSGLGKEPVTLGLSVAAFLFLMQRKQPLAAWLVLISAWGGWLLSRPFKYLVKRPRPISLNTLTRHPNELSFPSGHTVLAVCFYGILAWCGFKLFKKPLTRVGWALLMVNLILMIGFSRAYLKEHYPSDVLGGYLLGGFWLTVVVCSAGMYQPRAKSL